MEQVVTTLLCVIALSLLLTPCATSLQIDAQTLVHHDVHVPIPSYSRKLKLMQETTTRKDHNKPQEKMRGATTGGLQQNKETKKSKREYEEEIDPSELFTMDYRKVRRRRPIHNKSLPFGP